MTFTVTELDCLRACNVFLVVAFCWALWGRPAAPTE